MSNTDLCDQSCSSGRPFVLLGKSFNVEHYAHTFHPHSFILAVLIGTIGFYHFISLLPSEALTLAGSTKVSTKQNQKDSFSRTLFN